MKKTKKILSLALVLIMALSLCSVTSFADNIVSLTNSFSTIADILATVDGDFPTFGDASKYWTAGNGACCYLDGSLDFVNNGTCNPVSTSLSVTKVNDQLWTASRVDNLISFNLDNGKLASIVYEDTTSGFEKYCGTYTAPPHTHTLTEVTTCSPTCTELGVKTAYWVCSGEGGCGKCFTAQTGGTEISTEQLAATYIDPVKGHDFSGTLVQGKGENAGKHAAKCANCDAYGTVINGVHTEGWVTCTCDQTTDPTHKATDATCTDAATYYKTCICGYCAESGETFANGDPLGHSFDTENWTSDANEHWHAATCGHDTEKADVDAHVDESEKDHKCDVCGYVMSKCKDENGDGKCDICGKNMGAPVTPAKPARLTPLGKLVTAAVKVVSTVKAVAVAKTVCVIKAISRLFW